MMRQKLQQDALEYHSRTPQGKIQVSVTKPCDTQRDLSLAYTPGVAEPCRLIAQSPDAAYQYTAKGNLVAVISNGSAVLGLGDIGPLASKPVMEGKAVLFKRFADIDVFDLELDVQDPEEIVQVIKALAPTFGGINLEDIKAPDCFIIERRLREELDIPVFHDDQHGTAIIVGAALLNAAELAGKELRQMRTVINGAGASALACAEFLLQLGILPENLIVVDSKGVLYEGRDEGINEFKAPYARKTHLRTLDEAVEGADFLLGLSVPGAFTGEMIKRMAPDPIVFALANPDSEISYDEARAARPDVIMATGRSDYPNQVNNVLGFPFIFRGALDVRARAITHEMKIATAVALAKLAREGVPDVVLKAYGLEDLQFGREYLIPKPFDPRILIAVAPAVAAAAMESGSARIQLDIDEYKERLATRFGRARQIKHFIMEKARANPKRVVFSDGEEPKVIRAAAIMAEEGIGEAILIGRREVIQERARKMGLGSDLTTVFPEESPRFEAYVQTYFELRNRKGVTLKEARLAMRRPNTFGVMMVREGDADALIAGLASHYPEVIRPALQVVDTLPEVSRVAGLYIIIVGEEAYFIADPTVNIEPDAEALADIACLAADTVSTLGFEPKIAMLSFSNFGSARHPLSEKVRRATELVKKRRPDLEIDGEMQADTAVVPEILLNEYSFSTLKGKANTLIFPNLESANIAYKLLQRLAGAQAIGPLLMGTSRSIHILQRGDDVDDIVSVAAMAVLDAQRLAEPAHQ